MTTLTLLALLGLLMGPGPRAAGPTPAWRQLGPGLATRSVDGSAICRKGSPAIRIVRLDPAHWRLDVFHYSEKDERPVDIERWARRTGAPVAVNAGQYYPDRRPMGLFIKEGKNLGTPLIRPWKGMLVAEPGADPNAPRADILDLEYQSFDPLQSPWSIAVQSFMIVDHKGKKRVRRSEWHANRTILATDSRSALLMIHTEGAYTLWELAGWLFSSDLDVRHAMSLDGGLESQMVIRTGGMDYLSTGQWNVDDRGDHSLPGIRRSLPAIIAIFPR